MIHVGFFQMTLADSAETALIVKNPRPLFQGQLKIMKKVLLTGD